MSDILSLTVCSQHYCIGWCLLVTNQLLSAMGCASPYENYCYCATAPASFAKAKSFITACASTTCSAGDLSHDLTVMQSIYTSYCNAAGYTGLTSTTSAQPAPGSTPSSTTAAQPAPGSGSVATTTQVTFVTQTPSTGSAATLSQGKCLLLWVAMLVFLLQVQPPVPSLPRSHSLLIPYGGTHPVTIQVTSTIFAASPSSLDSGPSAVGLGMGLGLGLGLPLLSSRRGSVYGYVCGMNADSAMISPLRRPTPLDMVDRRLRTCCQSSRPNHRPRPWRQYRRCRTNRSSRRRHPHRASRSWNSRIKGYGDKRWDPSRHLP